MGDYTFEQLKWLVSLGVGGVLAGMMFIVYRKDMALWRKEKEKQSEHSEADMQILLDALRNNTEAMMKICSSVEANTKTLDFNTRSVDMLQSHCSAINRMESPEARAGT